MCEEDSDHFLVLSGTFPRVHHKPNDRKLDLDQGNSTVKSINLCVTGRSQAAKNPIKKRMNHGCGAGCLSLAVVVVIVVTTTVFPIALVDHLIFE